MIRAAFIGAGRRASGVHHPAVLRQKNVEVVAICDVIADLVERGAEELNIPRRYTDYKRMFDENDIDLVYAIVPPTVVTPIALDCLNAGKHLFIEKPAGMKSSDTALMVAAAERNDRLGAVGLQRRYEPVLTESMRLIAERGGIGTFLVEFHKSYLDGQLPFGQNSILDDGIHVADLMRHIGGGDARDVQVSRDRNFSDAVDVFAAHVHFTNGSLGVLYFLRHAGSRYLRYELHGNGISAYLRAPRRRRGVRGRRRRAADSEGVGTLRRHGPAHLQRRPPHAPTFHRVHRVKPRAVDEPPEHAAKHAPDGKVSRRRLVPRQPGALAWPDLRAGRDPLTSLVKTAPPRPSRLRYVACSDNSRVARPRRRSGESPSSPSGRGLG